jgi:hypothetical protein
MKRVVFAVFVCLLANRIVLADETLWTEWRDYMAGEWKTTGVLKEGIEGAVAKSGDKYQMQSRFHVSENGKSLVGTQTFRIDGNADYIATSTYLAGWDPVEKQIKILVFWSDGDIDEAVVREKKGSDYQCDYVFKGGSGKLHKSAATKKIIDQNTFEWASSGGQSIWKRVTQRSSNPQAWEFLTGKWTSVGGDGSKANIEWKLGADGKVAIGYWTGEDGSKSVEICGWRPDKGAMVADGYGSAGNYWHIDCTEGDETHLKGPCQLKEPNGLEMQGMFELHWTSDTTAEMTIEGTNKEGQRVVITSKFTKKAD